MTDNGRYESQVEFFRAIREGGDKDRLRAGLRAARLSRDSVYGSSVIRELARDAGYRRSTLYEYGQVARFTVRWQGLSARRIFDDHPALTYSHLRQVTRLDDFEDAVMALLHVEKRLTTPDHFSVLLARWKGKAVPPRPVFEAEGPWQMVLMALHTDFEKERYRNKSLRLQVWEVKA